MQMDSKWELDRPLTSKPVDFFSILPDHLIDVRQLSHSLPLSCTRVCNYHYACQRVRHLQHHEIDKPYNLLQQGPCKACLCALMLLCTVVRGSWGWCYIFVSPSPPFPTLPTMACPPSLTCTCLTMTCCLPPERYLLRACNCMAYVRVSLFRARSALSCCWRVSALWVDWAGSAWNSLDCQFPTDLTRCWIDARWVKFQTYTCRNRVAGAIV